MATIADELNAISVEHGYTGAAPKTIAGAIDALADTLAGTDVEERRTISGAVKALAPYIGGGGGTERVELFSETVTTVAQSGLNRAALAYIGNITDDPLRVVFDGVEYDLPRLDDGSYGALADGRPDLSTYPLFLGYSSGNPWTLLTETAGTHTVAAYVEKGLLGIGYGIVGGGITDLYVSEKPIADTDTDSQFSVSVSDDTSDVHLNNLLVPSGLYVKLLCSVSEGGDAPEVVGVDATVTETSTPNMWDISFQMPSNEVTIGGGIV